MTSGKTAKSILISCGARLAPFDIKELRDLMSYDELELDTLGDRKTALFLIMSDTDSTFNFVIAMLQSQLFNLLCDKADDEYGGKLPVSAQSIYLDFPVAIVVTLIAIIPTIVCRRFQRWQGVLMLAVYVAYLVVVTTGLDWYLALVA